MKRLLSLLVLLTPSFLLPALAEGNDKFGVWSEIGVEKAINRKWDVGLDLEYRAQDKARFSAGLSTSYKLFKNLKFGIGYNFLYSRKPEKYKDKSEGSASDDEWTVGYNITPKYWYPRHRFNVEATGSIKFWRWLKVSLRERYQLTHSKSRSITKYKHRENHIMQYEYDVLFDEDGFPVFDDDGNVMFDVVSSEEQTFVTDRTEVEYRPAYTDQVLRSRLKLEYDKKRCPYSPFISAEFHNSVSTGDHMLLQKIRTAVGTSYKFNKHHEVSLSYMVTFDMYDIDEDETTNIRETVRLHDRWHALNIGYKYSF